jgi:hypothetical protein
VAIAKARLETARSIEKASKPIFGVFSAEKQQRKIEIAMAAAAGVVAVGSTIMHLKGWIHHTPNSVHDLSNSIRHILPGVVGGIAGYNRAAHVHPEKRGAAVCHVVAGAIIFNAGTEVAQSVSPLNLGESNDGLAASANNANDMGMAVLSGLSAGGVLRMNHQQKEN